MRYRSKRNSQEQLIAFLTANPMKTEKEICMELWGEKRGKKHADLVRRALYKHHISRVQFKTPGTKGRALIYYYITKQMTHETTHTVQEGR